jgi:hypothetical protein
MLVLTSSVLVSWLAFLNPRLAFGSWALELPCALFLVSCAFHQVFFRGRIKKLSSLRLRGVLLQCYIHL